MNSPEASRTSGYYSELTLTNLENHDQPDIGNVSVSNLDRIIFDRTDQERPPFHLRCCCSDAQVDRSLTIVIIHYLILLAVIIFCIAYLSLCSSDSKFAAGVLVLLSACIGHVLPGPKS